MQDKNPRAFPKVKDQERIDAYEVNDKLYKGKHFEAFKILGNKDFDARYRELRYIVANFAGLMSRLMGDMLFSEPLKIDFEDDNIQKFIDQFIIENELFSQLYESAVANSRRGDSCFKLRIGPRDTKDTNAVATIIVEEFNAKHYIAVFDRTGVRNVPSEEIIWDMFSVGETDYIHFEKHTPGTIVNEVWTYDKNKRELVAQVMDVAALGYEPEIQTKVDRSLIFHVPNIRDGSGYYGTSDYEDLKSLFFALNNRITKTDNILDKHSDPILAVPPGVLDEDGNIKKEELGMFEVDNENPGFNKPEYIVWNANLDSAMKEIDKLVDFLFLFSEISPASVRDDGAGAAESGRALKLKLQASIRKAMRKVRHYDQVIKDMLYTAQELARVFSIRFDGVSITKPEMPKIKWPDGVINDIVEEVDVITKRVDAGLMSRQDAIAELDGLTRGEAEKKVQEIDEENTPTIPDISNNTNGSGPVSKEAAISSASVEIQKTALNGAQISSLLEIVQQIASKTLPFQTGRETILASFPALEAVTVDKILNPVKSFSLPTENKNQPGV